MDKKRRDSVSGQMRLIGKFQNWKRKSLQGLGLIGRGKKEEKEVNKNVDEMDDIELLERLVHEHVDFDWEQFEKQRDQSVFLSRQSVASLSSVHKALENNQEKGDVEKIEVGSDNEEPEEAVIDQISTDGKEKLKFIMEFARSKDNSNKLVRITSEMAALDPHQILKLNKMNQAKMSRTARIALAKKQKQTKKKQLSIVSTTSQDEIEKMYNRRLTQIFESKAKNQPQISLEDLKDQFARYKGFKSAKHMQTYLERLRGFEELKNETQIDLMARENGYKPARSDRFQSVLSYLGDNGVKSDAEDNKLNLQESEEESDNEVSSDSDVEDKELAEFMALEGNDLEEIAKEWEKVKGFNKESDEENDKEVENITSDKEKNEKTRKERRKRAIKKGWERTKLEHENDFTQRKLRPYDSLTSMHLKELHEGEEENTTKLSRSVNEIRVDELELRNSKNKN